MRERETRTGRGDGRFVFGFLLLYAGVLVWLLPKLSLWLDEILDLISARQASLPDLVRYVQTIPGAVPFAYIVQRAFIHVFGLSAFSGRLPSALSSIASCAGIYWLGRRANLRWPLTAVLVFAICPLQLRYALEARDYALALALSVWLTVLFLRILDRPQILAIGLYGFCVLAGLYTQPYSFFVPLGHVMWLVLSPSVKGRRVLLLRLIAVIGISALLFLPWYLSAANLWKTAIVSAHEHGRIDFRSVLLVIREISGMGYLGIGLYGIAIVLALRRRAPVSLSMLWLISCLVPIAGVLATDAVFGYFLAIRQMIFVLPALSVLFAAGIESLMNDRTSVAVALAAAFSVAGLWNDVKLFQRPREDWQAAAMILGEQARSGACTLFAPPDSEELYAFFRPDLARTACTTEDLSKVSEVALAVSPYDVKGDYPKEESALRGAGFLRESVLNASTPRIEIYRRILF